MGDENNNPKETRATPENEWMIRTCAMYDEEYSECTSIKDRFHQYFVYGKTTDCSQWKRDSINCYKWTEKEDVKAAEELIESEQKRRRERLLSHYRNDVWSRRDRPPEGWSSPLPDYYQKEYENSYLNLKARELRGEAPPSVDLDKIPTFRCSIM